MRYYIIRHYCSVRALSIFSAVKEMKIDFSLLSLATIEIEINIIDHITNPKHSNKPCFTGTLTTIETNLRFSLILL